MKKQSFLAGAIVLTISGIVCKILGALYKIPLTNILGSQGMGIYYIIFPVYAFMLTFVSSCFTISISKAVSAAVAKDDFSAAHKYFKASLLLLFLIGGGLCLVMFLLAKIISNLQGLSNIYICYFIIAPSIIAVAVQSGFKGFFQGLQNMTPSAISQILEQIVKLTVGFSLASLLVGRGVLWGACGALVGILISEVSTCAYFAVSYFAFKIKNKNLYASGHTQQTKTLKTAGGAESGKYKCENLTSERGKRTSQKECMKEVFLNAVPFMLSSLIIPLSLMVDSFLIVNILKSMGFDKFFATALLGLNSGVVSTLVSLPATVSSSLCTTIVPYITFSIASGNNAAVSQKIGLAMKLTFIISLPCFFVFVFFSPNIIKILYSFESIYEHNLASSLLMISSVNVLYLAVLQLTIAILQAFGKSYIPVVNLTIGLVFKVVFECVLIYIPSLNISGAIVSNIVCYLVPCLLNSIQIKKYAELRLNLWQTFAAPTISSAVMIATIFMSIQLFSRLFSFRLGSLFAFLAGAIIYFACILLFKTFSKEEKQSFLLFKAKKKAHTA